MHLNTHKLFLGTFVLSCFFILCNSRISKETSRGPDLWKSTGSGSHDDELVTRNAGKSISSSDSNDSINSGHYYHDENNDANKNEGEDVMDDDDTDAVDFRNANHNADSANEKEAGISSGGNDSTKEDDGSSELNDGGEDTQESDSDNGQSKERWSSSSEDISFSASGSGSSEDDGWLGSLDEEDDEVSIIFGGDINFDGPQRRLVEDEVCTYNGYMKKLKKLFNDADIKVANLESPVSNDITAEHPATGVFNHLLAPDKSVKALKYTGIDVVTLSNNHMLDWGESVIKKTEHALNKSGIQYVGITEGMTNLANQQPLIVERKGLKFGFLAYCRVETCLERRPGYKIGMGIYSSKVMAQDVEDLKDKVDFVIVLMHWSDQYVLYRMCTKRTAPCNRR